MATEKSKLQKRIRQENRVRDRESESRAKNVERIFNDAIQIAIEEEITFDEALSLAGFTEEMESASRALTLELEMVREEFENITDELTFTEEDAVVAEAIIDAEISRITTRAQAAGTDIAAIIQRSNVLDEDVDRRSLQVLTERAANNFRTELNTSMAAFNRTMTIKKSKDLFGPDPEFLYVGPDDSVTREFCQDILDGAASAHGRVRDRSIPVYKLSEIARLDNGQGLDVFSSGGGYNCRHDWRPISSELRRELFGQ